MATTVCDEHHDVPVSVSNAKMEKSIAAIGFGGRDDHD
jgi:hypothetical protein